ncbi:ComC/BlpC family peptide pheromone/bacteriocin [Streptococcus equi]|uniref:ComC/BlpC family peptide pheromone/bacteriocin n=1 Tax=Streptococcus equi subsp. ruminatorum TaxID=254358 RepID=A0A6M1KY75_9STRE|nr:ComC/BlpC family peptide pheromone/bacteriocin [Streptococcus equi]NGL84031.1 ComC/BlpC family peptide pheromone/bacteriocin [Streptococcus equi subsp. ruminatorum]
MNATLLEQFVVLNPTELAAVEGGWGYIWKCTQNGKPTYSSAWHGLYHTAAQNAQNHMDLYPGSICRVYNA